MSKASLPPSDRILAAFRRLEAALVPWEGTVFRSATPQYASGDAILSGEGSRRYGGRWNPPDSFPTVYASLSPETAMAESLAHFRYYGIPLTAAMPRLFVAIEVRFSWVLDLREGSIRQRIGVSHRRMLDAPWRSPSPPGLLPITQAIGRAAFEAGLEGLLVPSVAHRKGGNLVVFPTHRKPSSLLRLAQPETRS